MDSSEGNTRSENVGAQRWGRLRRRGADAISSFQLFSYFDGGGGSEIELDGGEINGEGPKGI